MKAFMWTATGMRQAQARNPFGPRQYVTADDYEALEEELKRLLSAGVVATPVRLKENIPDKRELPNW